MLLVGVSKTVDVGRIRQAIEAGVPALGENRVQEARGKIAEIGRPVPWHLVGHLQTNKVRDALELFDLIHSLDRLELAKELDKRGRARGRAVDTLVEVNVGGEASKGGAAPDGLGELLEAVAAMPHVRVRGLMAIPPEAKEPDASRVWFRALRKLGERHGLSELSMGMSGDFEVAIEEGATIVRVGTAIFGPRLVVPAEAIHATDVRLERLKELNRQYGIQISSDNAELIRRADIVILAVKPQIMDAVLTEIAPAVTRRKLLISIAAGVSTAKIRAVLHKDARLIRVMPNTPALVLEGVTAVAKAEGLEADDLETAGEIFGAVGRVVVLGEELMDAVTGLSGSGPAYIAVVIESLADGGVRMGLDRITAMTLATQTVLGAATLLRETGLHPGAVKDMVCSPGGTSIAGIAALEEGGIRTTFIKAVERATQRSRELGQGPK